uniref:Transcription elongation factor 1 homolog n=1 Tax=Arcella intermedia TaxID=1963864 RepID=A0A6B2LUW7_9EUKA
MGKRKSRKKPKPKPKDPGMPTTFDCPYCVHPGAVECTIRKKEGRGFVSCRVCGVRSSPIEITRLTSAVDIYNDWIDKCEDINRPPFEEHSEEN